MNNLQTKIQEQEKKDRYVGRNCLKYLLRKGNNLQMNDTKLLCPVDLKCSVVNQKGNPVKFNVEIKERNKSDWQLKHYPEAELKVDKYNRMRNETPEGTVLLYMVLLNQKDCLIFNMNKLDWKQVEERNWLIKQTQMKEDSEKKETPTYFIPYSLATAKCDCSNFFEDYELILN